MSDRPVAAPGAEAESADAEQLVADRPPESRPPDARAAADLCPFLATVDGDWRSVIAIREHRCAAVEPAAVLALEKQRRLCLVQGHTSCATYMAARQRLGGDDTDGTAGPPSNAQAADMAASTGHPILRWAVPRTAPVVLDRGRPSVRELVARRSTTQMALVVLMALAFLVLALARLSANDSGSQAAPSGAASSPAAAPSGSHNATPLAPSGTPAVSPSAAATGTPTAAASRTPAVSPSPSRPANRTYRVVAGDTLSGIASRFGVTVRAIEAANGITNPSLIRVGTVLVIP